MSIRTAWLYKYYPYEYLTAVLNSNLGNNKKLPQYLSVVRSNNISLLPPDVNYSQFRFSTDGKNIRTGLSGLKSVGTSAENVLNERREHGEFKSLEDFLYRMSKYQTIDKRILEAFIKVGMFDKYKGSRKDKLEQIDKFLKFRDTVVSLNKDYSIFDAYDSIRGTIGSEWDALSLDIVESGDDYSNLQRLLQEKETAGMFISGSPLQDFKKDLKGRITSIGEILSYYGNDDQELDEEQGSSIKQDDQLKVEIAGVVEELAPRISKNNKTFYTFNIEDDSGVLKAVYFPKDKDEMMNEGQVIKAHVRVSNDDFGISAMVNDFTPLVESTESKNGIILVDTIEKNMEEALKGLTLTKGDSDIILKDNKTQKTIIKNIKLSNLDNIRKIRDVIGDTPLRYELKGK